MYGTVKNMSYPALNLNLPYPVPDGSNPFTEVGRFDVRILTPDAVYCYAGPNAQLDPNWEERSKPNSTDQVLQIVQQNLCNLPEERRKYFGGAILYTDDLAEYYENSAKYRGMLPSLQHLYERNNSHSSHAPFYALRTVLLQSFHQKRFAAGWHPNVRIWNRKEELTKFDQNNLKIKEARKAKKEMDKERRRARRRVTK